MNNVLKNTNTKFILIRKINVLAAQFKKAKISIEKTKTKRNTSKVW